MAPTPSTTQSEPPISSLPGKSGPLYLLFFLFGISGLIYEVLWMKELGVLFGDTAYAVATTLTVFFLGLSAGCFTWGRKSKKLRRPLAVYALLELAIAASASLYFFILNAYHSIYGPLFVRSIQTPAVIVFMDPFHQPLVSLKKGESLLEVVEGSQATLAAVRGGRDELSMRTNNHYGLGTAKNYLRQQEEAELPLVLTDEKGAIRFTGRGGWRQLKAQNAAASWRGVRYKG